MEELKPFDTSEENKLTQEPLINNENSFFKKNKTLIIIIASILVLAIMITVLCVCLLKGSNGDEGDKGDEEDKNYDVIKLEVYSDSDDKEILFLSDEFNLRQENLKGNEIMYVDGKSYPFSKSMKLKKGNHIVKLFLNETKNSCENMFKNCKDIKSIYFNNSYNCQDNMENMFNGCSSLISVNFDKIQTSNVTTMKNLFNDCVSLKNISFNNLDTSKVIIWKKCLVIVILLKILI